MRTKTAKKPALFRSLFGHALRGPIFAALAGAFGVAGAYATASVVPGFTASLVGPLYCPPQAEPQLVTVYDVQFRDWENRLWQLPTPQFRCASARGLPVAPTHSGFDLGWYGVWAAGAAGMTGLLYAMWTVTSSLAYRPAPHSLSPAAAESLRPPQDLPALFLEECCELAPKQRAPAAQLYAAYAAWSRAKGHRPPASKTLARDWVRLGLRPRRFLGYNVWRGAKLKM